MRSLRDRIVGQVRPLLLVLLGAVGFVLLIACTNVAHLMLARATTRRKEIAVRFALGAGRFQLMRQLLTESLVLSLFGGAFGLIWAAWGIKLLLAIVPEHTLEQMPFLRSAHTDFGALLFLLAVTLLSACAFGIMPALQMSKSDCTTALKEEERTSASKHTGLLRDGLVVAELAVSIVLLTGAGLMVRSLSALLKQNPGFDGHNLLTFVVSLPDTAYKDNNSLLQFESRFSDTLRQLPGVQGTAVVSRLPVMGAGNTVRFVFEGRPKATGSEDEANIRDVTPPYFPLMKIPVLQGRNYDPRDDSKAPPRMVVNQAFADRYLPGENPLGKRLRFTYASDNPYMEIIGVVANENSDGLDAPMQPILYASFSQGPDSAFYVVVRTSADPLKLLPAVRGALHDMDPQIPVIDPRSMEEVISDTYAVFLRRFPSRLVTCFASLALLLAVIGLYGQISFSVTQRTREIGIRMAMGARSVDVLRLIVGKGIALTLGGLLLGFVAALALTRLLTSLLFGVTPSDPWTLAAVAALLATVAIVASLIPARRATRVDPMVALRYE
jgi:putative ABC transport system permease protein